MEGCHINWSIQIEPSRFTLIYSGLAAELRDPSADSGLDPSLRFLNRRKRKRDWTALHAERYAVTINDFRLEVMANPYTPD